MTEKNEKHVQRRVGRRAIEIAVVAMVVVFLSVFATLLVTGTVKLPAGYSSADNDDTTHYTNVTLTDAQLECLDHAKSELGRRIKTINVDDHSSRYDSRNDRFKVFMEADVYDEEAGSGLAKHYYINCYSRTDRLSVTTFELLEDRDLPVRPIRQSSGGNAFGI